MGADQPRRPKTTPTGYVPSAAKKTTAPAETESRRPQLLSKRAWLVRVCYCDERSRWESMRCGRRVEYRPPRSYDGLGPITVDGETELETGKNSEWSKLVTWCDSHEIHPEEYVRIVYNLLPHNLVHPVEPQQLRSPKYLKVWRAAKDKLEERFRIELLTQKRLARTEIVVRQNVYGNAYDYACLQAVTAGNLPLSPLFRYCLAISIGTPPMAKVARANRNEAVMQFMRHRKLYRKVWADLLPKGFAKFAEQAYPELLESIGMRHETEE